MTHAQQEAPATAETVPGRDQEASPDMPQTSNSLTLPDPHEITAANVATFGHRVLAAANLTSDVNEVIDLAAKWSAIAQYIRRTSTEGVKEAEATQRRLEVRIGELSPPTPNDGQRMNQYTRSATGKLATGTSLPVHDLKRARKLAAHPDIVEEVIAESTDSRPPSRNKILNRIAGKERKAEADADQAQFIERFPQYPEIEANYNQHERPAAEARWELMGHGRRLAEAIQDFADNVDNIDDMYNAVAQQEPAIATRWRQRWNNAVRTLICIDIRESWEE